VALVLYQTIEKFQAAPGKKTESVTPLSFFHALWVFTLIFLGSLAVGCFIGMVTSLIMKYTSVQKLPLVEQALFTLLSYTTFLIGEAGGLSGIVAVLFCGITQAHYTFDNLSEESRKTTKVSHISCMLYSVVEHVAEHLRHVLVPCMCAALHPLFHTPMVPWCWAVC
jgi:NhaP-type Na+/H+ or K+/H+ antiporter